MHDATSGLRLVLVLVLVLGVLPAGERSDSVRCGMAGNSLIASAHVVLHTAAHHVSWCTLACHVSLRIA